MTKQTSNRKNDAWFTIRGFVYQVNQSILEWIKLDENEHLELETDEDIDKVISGVKEQRQLSQIKHLDGNITLRTPAFKESVVNCFEHLELDPNIKFLLISNSQIGRETKIKFYDDDGKQINGLHAWKLINQGKLSSSLIQNLRKIKEVINEFAPPKLTENDKSDQKWVNYVTKTSNGYDFNENLIKKFFILDNQLEAKEVEGTIKNMLIEKEYVNSDIQADQLNKILFFKVFEIISQKDPTKILHKEWFTKVKLLEIIEDHKAANIDHKLQLTLNKFHTDYLDGKFEALNDQLNEIGDQIGSMPEEIAEKLKRTQDEIDLSSFKDVKDIVFNDFQLTEIKKFLNSFKDLILNKLTPQEICDVTISNGNSRLFFPYTKKFEDKIKKKGLWKGWLTFLTYLYIYSNKVVKPDSNSKIQIDNLVDDCRLYFTESKFAEIVKNIIYNQQHIDDIRTADSLFFITEDEKVMAATIKRENIVNIINGDYSLKRQVRNHTKLNQQITNGDLSEFPRLNHISLIDREVDSTVMNSTNEKIEISIKKIMKEIFKYD